jgi:carboxyl-terminal processing protease
MLIAAGFIGYLIGQAGEPDVVVATPVTIAEVAPEEQAVSMPAQVTDVPPTATVEPAPTDTAEPSTATPAPTATPIPTAEAIIDPTAAPVIISDGTSPLEQADLNTLYDVWEVIADQYDGTVPLTTDILDAAIAGSLETLDDEFTRYVPADIAERMRQDMTGAVEGIGAFVQENDEGLFEIVRPIDGQPADLAGLKAGDIIIEVDGESMLGVSFDEVILLVRGPEGTLVNLKVQREGELEPLEFDIVRTRFEVPVVEFEMLPDELTGGAPIGYIRLTEFNLNADERLREGLTEILAQQPQGIVFDLRDNPGGFLDQSVAVADAFLPEGVALFERNIRGLDETFRTDDGDPAETIPMVVLVNAGSASASEIVAGAIQDRGRATLVGETTFGKGSVQQIYTLSDGSELRVTIARWYTPNNSTIDKEGITPDIEVETPEDLGGAEDGQLMRAIELLLTGQ